MHRVHGKCTDLWTSGCRMWLCTKRTNLAECRSYWPSMDACLPKDKLMRWYTIHDERIIRCIAIKSVEKRTFHEFPIRQTFVFPSPMPLFIFHWARTFAFSNFAEILGMRVAFIALCTWIRMLHMCALAIKIYIKAPQRVSSIRVSARLTLLFTRLHFDVVALSHNSNFIDMNENEHWTTLMVVVSALVPSTSARINVFFYSNWMLQHVCTHKREKV